MGYRLHYAEQFKVRWGVGFFGSKDVDTVFDILSEADCINWSNENSDEWEVDKLMLGKLIAALRKAPQEDSEIEDYTNENLADIFQEMLDKSEPDEAYIRVEWF